MSCQSRFVTDICSLTNLQHLFITNLRFVTDISEHPIHPRTNRIFASNKSSTSFYDKSSNITYGDVLYGMSGMYSQDLMLTFKDPFCIHSKHPLHFRKM